VPGKRWSRKLLDTIDLVLLLWVYKVVDMKDSRRGGTKVLSVVDVILSSNGRDEVVRARCYRYGASPFPFPSQKRLLTESSPLDPPSARNCVPVTTRVRTCTNGHAS
jgi:hypothetical protein